MFAYFKASWPDEIVPEGEPTFMLYEVRVARDIVTRIVDVFLDGHTFRDSIKLAEREGLDNRELEYRSLVNGPFLEYSRKYLAQISESEFNHFWNSANDKPWPPPS